VRIGCSLCGLQMFDLDLCLSASLNVIYILHTHTPLGLYYKSLREDVLGDVARIRLRESTKVLFDASDV
jgi:hypothetical protein